MQLSQWHQILQNSTPSLTIADGRVQSFGDLSTEKASLLNGTVLADLSHWGLLQLEGADTVNFLQGQVTNDVRLLNGSNAHYTGYCSPKGRLLALFLAFSHQDHLHLQLPRELVEPIMKRLKMFVLRSKVTITDMSEQIVRFGLSGPQAPALLQNLFAQVPQADYELVSLENSSLIKLPGQQPRYEIFVPLETALSIWQALSQQATPVGADAWEWLEIQAGIPEIYPQTQEEFVPQMLNLDALNAINYKKGCYTGQEIVARTHYLGKVKRRTQLAHISGTTAPALNDDVLDVNGQAVGKIVRVAPAYGESNGGFDVLAECRLENVAQDAIFWQGQLLTLKQLPYTLETSANS